MRLGDEVEFRYQIQTCLLLCVFFAKNFALLAVRN